MASHASGIYFRLSLVHMGIVFQMKQVSHGHSISDETSPPAPDSQLGSEGIVSWAEREQ